jgi:hypothetical protein
MLKNRIYSISIDNEVEASVECCKWNSWDGDHLSHVHGSYSEPKFLYEDKNFGVFRDEMVIPIFKIPISVMAFVAQATDDTIISYTQIIGILANNTIKFEKLNESRTRINTTYRFEVPWFLGFLGPMLCRMAKSHNAKIWLEDLPLKLRRQQALNLGFVDYKGLPKRLSHRRLSATEKKSNGPLKRLNRGSTDAHPFAKQNLIRSPK